MAIEIKLEPEAFHLAQAELCIFCNEPTRFWNEKENKPVCESCADNFDQSDVDNHQYEGYE